jgi:thiosulfate oxidation carrier complex protein SoxZ
MAEHQINIKIPRAIKKGQVFLVSVRIEHPMDSGLRRDLSTGKRLPIFFVEKMEVRYGGKKVSWAELSPGLSHNPLLKFKLRAGQGGDLTVTCQDNKGLKFAHTIKVKLAA